MKWTEKHFHLIKWKETLSFQVLNKKLLCVRPPPAGKGGRYLWARSRERVCWGGPVCYLKESGWRTNFSKSKHTGDLGSSPWEKLFREPQCWELERTTHWGERSPGQPRVVYLVVLLASSTHYNRNHLKCTCRLGPITRFWETMSFDRSNKK